MDLKTAQTLRAKLQIGDIKMIASCVFLALLIAILFYLAEEEIELERQQLENAKMDEEYYQCINRTATSQFKS